ncbi:leucine-rich repeat domain-containing protein [Evansella clarkii]|uniref:leucine-rich repeat domain-containing protein n=1 Tax=Evansella clarkii TaxID=79879 RepID=UPI000997A4BB|nr:leucine-rich repeat domain-containing protein [Evansella clarkii]
MIHFKTTDAKYFRFDEFRREITGYEGEETNVVIPAEIDGVEVVSIGPDAFWNKGLTSVILPPTLSVIGFYAFAFNKLTDIRIPSSVALIEDGAFMYNQLETLRLGEDIFTISRSVFQHNRLSKLVLPENTQEIQSEAFSDNPITEMTFEGMPTFIHRHAFNLGEAEMSAVTVKGPHSKSLQALLDHHADYVDAYRVLRDRHQ